MNKIESTISVRRTFPRSTRTINLVIALLAASAVATTLYLITTNANEQQIDITPVISYGQSVSTGSNDGRSPRISDSPHPIYGSHALTHISESTSLTPLVQSNFERHDSGMLEVALEQYRKNNQPMPYFLSLNAGSGGKSIQQLSVKKEHIVTSVQQGASVTPTNYFFAVLDESSYDIYYDRGTSTPELLQANVGEPTHYDTMLERFRDAKRVAEQNGYAVSKNILFNWTQGQSNTANLDPGYDYFLSQLIDMLEDDLSAIYGSPVNVTSMVNQMNQYTSRTGDSQFMVIRNRPDVHFGSPEYSRQTKYPQTTAEGIGPHLNNLGYRIMGEQMGYQLYDILTKGYSVVPYIAGYKFDGDTKVTLDFGGVRGSLVIDPSMYNQTYTEAQKVPNYIQDLSTYITDTPTHHGFTLRSSTGADFTYSSISSVEQTGDRQFTITLNRKPNTDFRIMIGDNKNRVIGSMIRDSVQHNLQTATQNWSDISVHKVQRFAMSQFVPIQPNNTNYQTISVAGLPEPQEPLPTASGDLNSDSKINIFDLSILLSKWGSTAGQNTADINSDGKVDIFDLSILLSKWSP